ncbi:DUF6641 family protein [uncultured Paraglaciecola sp.]|uniref:DUF6641 family protein n=1 Tax=uncultured Paraglaciecola sp. TaxID=1765024 RepID=UPI00260BEB97|nr:DUF6641 family protein [uncultured Paraglaciecola sp.]
MTKSILSSLKLSARPVKVQESPLIKRRERLLTQLGVQKDMIQAQLDGERFTAYTEKWQLNPETNKKELIRTPKKVLPWFYKNNGKHYLEIRYGNKALPLAKDKQAIEIGDFKNLMPTIELVIKAVIAGELDELLLAIVPINTNKKTSVKAASSIPKD